MGAKTERPYGVMDVEGGPITHTDIKAAREVTEDVLGEMDQLRLANLMSDLARDDDTSLTRATRDRDRATPRDVSHIDSVRLRRELPADITFREALSARQRNVRSVLKNRVLAAAPKSQHHAVNALLSDPDPSAWQRINAGLHEAAGDVHSLAETDRAMVQRLDRLLHAYEAANDRDHTVYVAVQLPEGLPDVFDKRDLPEGLTPGTRLAFDQFTPAKHDLHELPGHDDQRIVVIEMVTSRGMYMGSSGKGHDTSHLLPRGMHLQLTGAEVVPYETPEGFGERLVVQARELSTKPSLS